MKPARDVEMVEDLFERRLAREKAARREAEALLETKTYELYLANTRLEAVAHELQEHSSRLDAILNRTKAAILLVDADGMIARANPRAEADFGRASGQMTGHPIMTLFSRNCQILVETLIEPGEGGHDEDDPAVELTGVRGDKTLFPVEAAVAKLNHGEDEHTVWFCRDLSRQREAEARRGALEQALRQSQKLESLGTLASGVAHEINTPVQFVSDNLHFLRGAITDINAMVERYQQAVDAIAGQAPELAAALGHARDDADLDYLLEETPRSIDQSLEGVQRISQIVGAIKEFAHPGSKEKVAFDLNKAIDTTVTVCRNQWKYVAEVDLDLDPDLPPVLGHPGDVNQVLLNLIVNAAQAIESRKLDGLGRIAITTRAAADIVTVIVADNGCGIPPADMPKLFDPFFTTKGVGKGTGQGLSIVYNIVVNNHGGTIDIASQPGEGTQFTITLPAASGMARGREAA